MCTQTPIYMYISTDPNICLNRKPRYAHTHSPCSACGPGRTGAGWWPWPRWIWWGRGRRTRCAQQSRCVRTSFVLPTPCSWSKHKPTLYSLNFITPYNIKSGLARIAVSLANLDTFSQLTSLLLVNVSYWVNIQGVFYRRANPPFSMFLGGRRKPRGNPQMWGKCVNLHAKSNTHKIFLAH